MFSGKIILFTVQKSAIFLLGERACCYRYNSTSGGPSVSSIMIYLKKYVENNGNEVVQWKQSLLPL